MNDKQVYYLGIVLSYIIGAIITPFFGVFIAVVRLLFCVVGILWDTFMFVPRVVNAWQDLCWRKEAKSALDKANLN
jgi:uncharacterized iron-regulated membrane protein|tara:strand:- start:304 stop:531 length:228 start_codon:yes stop_codon:yes gene_type:complete